MAVGVARQLKLLILILFIACPVYGTGQALYVDRSGSMESYYDTGLVFDLCERISVITRTHGKTSPQLVAFSTDSTLVKSIEGLRGVPLGKDTYLNKAIEDAIGKKFKIVWMITDNLQDEAGAGEGENTAAFYEILRGRAVRKVAIFPIVRSSGATTVGSDKQGIVIYALLLDKGLEDEFEREVKELTASLKSAHSTEGLRMKPLDEKSIESSIVKSSFDGGKNKTVYKEGDDIRGTMEIKFRSNFEHLKISDASVEPDLSYGFGPATLFTFEQPDLNITPTRLSGLDPKGETGQVYQVSVDLGRIRLKRDIVSIWKAAWGQLGEDGSLKFSFVVKVPRNSLVFKQDFLNAYNAASPGDARAMGKVYAIDQLPSLLAEDVTVIRVESPQPFRVKYPWWPAPLVFTVLLAALALLIWLIWWSARIIKGLSKGRPQWEVEVFQPPNGRGSIQGDQVKVTLGPRRVMVGTIKKGSLHPSSVIQPRDVQPITDGGQIRLTHKKDQVVLIFRRQVQQQPKETGKKPTGGGVRSNGKVKI